MVALGTAKYTYEVAESWGKLPPGWSYKECAAVGVDSNDNVYVFNRGTHPMIVFNSEGDIIETWGDGLFKSPHGVTIGPDGSVYCVDNGNHTVRKFTKGGELLMELQAGHPAPAMSGDPFNRPAHLAIDANTGDMYVADGYSNARVHKYDPTGRLLFSWGESGTGPGQFNIAHNIATDKDGWVYVADRENQRIQVFDKNGKFETQWKNMARPCGLYIDPTGDQTVYVGELGVAIGPNSQATSLGPRITIMDVAGNTLAKLGDVPEGEQPGTFIAPHGVCTDSRGDIYVAEVSWTHTGSNLTPPREVRSLQKLVRKG